VAGLRKKNRLINPHEREVVAVHESGHALVAAFTEGADKVHKISIIPRGIGALGHTQQLPTDDRYLMTRKELEARVDVLFGGRAAESIVFDEVSTGAANDLDRATDIVRSMVLEYGMSDTLGPMTFPRRHGPAFLADRAGLLPEQREYSEATAQALDTEVKRILDERLARVVALLTEKRPLLDRVSRALLEKETLEAAEFEALVRGEGADSGRHVA
jgi:cell division protease FtsH